MRWPYFEFGKKVFQNKMVYRFDCLLGILNTCLQILIFWCIYKTLYHSRIEVNGVTFSMVTTNFILALGLSGAFTMNDFFIQWKVNDGTIANELLKPVSFRGRILAETLGEVSFNLLFRFLPALIIAVLVIGMLPPVSILGFVVFIVSAILGFLVLWNLNFIVQVSAFWIVNVWSVSTLKSVVVNVLSGSLLPLWFMPPEVLRIIRYTPFDSIYFIPIRIYLGEVQSGDIIMYLVRQMLWIVLLFGFGEYLWHRGQRKLVIQGG